MAILRAVVNTDQVNKQNICVPVKALVGSVERQVAFSLENKLPLGSPSFISHDLTRLAGWSSSPSTVLCRDMATQVAFIHYPEIQADEQTLREVSDAYRKSTSEHYRAEFEQELRRRVNQQDLGGATADFSHCATLIRDGLVSELYPEFFSLESTAVDKDGLTYYDELTSAFDVVQPGIFHDKKRNLLIFATSSSAVAFPVSIL